MDDAHKEQIKLAATYRNGLAVATFAVGTLGPILSSLTSHSDAPVWLVAVSGLVCILASFA